MKQAMSATVNDDYEMNLAKMLEEQQNQSDVMIKETFYGIKHILESQNIDTVNRPVILII